MEKRVFLIVLDSFGIGAEPDAPVSYVLKIFSKEYMSIR